MDGTEVDLAFALLEDAFGPLVARVGRVLLLHRSVSFLELRELVPQSVGVKDVTPSLTNASFSGASGGGHVSRLHDAYCRLRNALLVLVQHNMLSCCLAANPASSAASSAGPETSVTSEKEEKGQTEPSASAVNGSSPGWVSHGGVRYSLVLESVLALLWFPGFVAAVEEIHGSDAALLLLQVLKAGRLCMQDAVALALADPYSATFQGEAASESRPGGAWAERGKGQRTQELQRSFLALVSSAFITQCRPFGASSQIVEAEHSAASQPNTRKRRADTTASKAKQTNSHSGNGATAKQGEQALQARPLQVSSRNVLRFLMPPKEIGEVCLSLVHLRNLIQQYTPEGSDVDDGEEHELPGFLLSMLDDKSQTEARSAKRARTGSDKASLPENGKAADELVEKLFKQRIPFRVNTPLLALITCKRAVERFVVARVGESKLVRAAVSALLTGVKLRSTGISADGTASLGFKELQTNCRWLTFDFLEQTTNTILLKQQPRGSAIQKTQLIRLLDGLAKHPDGLLVTSMKDGQAAYRLNWTRLRVLLQRRVISEVVESRCGTKGLRVWQLMLASVKPNAYFDEQTIADGALLPPHGARSVMYALAFSGFARFHESDRLPPSANTSGGSTTKHGLVISLSEANARRRVASLLQRAAINSIHRKRAETERLALLHCRTAKEMSEDEALQQRRRETAEDLLDANLLKLSEPILILRGL